MYENGKKQDEKRLYEQLMSGTVDFCVNLSWLADKAFASDNSERFMEMWKVYYAVMMKIGQQLFGSDVYWNSHSEEIEPVLNLLLNEGYSDIILQLILGAANLFVIIKQGENESFRLKNIAAQYYATVQHYSDAGVLTTENRLVKWDFIDKSNRCFGAAFDIVELESHAELKGVLAEERVHRAEREKALEEKFYELFGEQDPSPENKAKKFIKKMISKKK